MKRAILLIALVADGGLILCVAPGCGVSRSPSVDPASARQALDRTLTAWRDGKAVDSLKLEDPPLEVADHQWTGGLKLVKYEVKYDHPPDGPRQSFRVILWLKDKRSKQTKVVTQYDVTTSPLRVVRAGF
jgi:hypothetical protein